MNEEEYLEHLNQVDFDLAFLRKRVRTLGFNLAVAEMEENTLEANKLRRYKKQHERYIGYAKCYRKSLSSKYTSIIKGAAK